AIRRRGKGIDFTQAPNPKGFLIPEPPCSWLPRRRRRPAKLRPLRAIRLLRRPPQRHHRRLQPGGSPSPGANQGHLLHRPAAASLLPLRYATDYDHTVFTFPPGIVATETDGGLVLLSVLVGDRSSYVWLPRKPHYFVYNA
uniref:Uncharacterized protein n=1 Tax=Triticum urartu TaxID=4572 RepID=A0A8R7PZ04_TRIUA